MSDAPPVAATTGSDKNKKTKMINLNKIVLDMIIYLLFNDLHDSHCRDRVTITASFLVFFVFYVFV